MGRIVVSEFVSLDGVMEDPGGAEGFEQGGWAREISRGEEGDRFKLDETLDAEALLLGRVTSEGFAAAWPSREGESANKFNKRLMVFPVVLGSGKRLFAGGVAGKRLRLSGSQTVGDGVAILAYEPAVR